MLGQPIVRSAQPDDLRVLCQLIAEHAKYERAAPPPPRLAQQLAPLMFGPDARLHVLLATPPTTEIIGYASWSLEVSTWQGLEYAHLDCLYVREQHRGLGIGQLLFDRVKHEAAQVGATELRWQTPEWNDGAARFYDRNGGRFSRKLRYALPLTENIRPDALSG